MLYRVMNTIVDGVNGLHIKYGVYVNTTEKQWVARMGSSLKEEFSAPPNSEIIDVTNTQESFIDLDEGVIIIDEDPPVNEKKGLTKTKLPNKAMLGDDSENK